MLVAVRPCSPVGRLVQLQGFRFIPHGIERAEIFVTNESAIIETEKTGIGRNNQSLVDNADACLANHVEFETVRVVKHPVFQHAAVVGGKTQPPDRIAFGSQPDFARCSFRQRGDRWRAFIANMVQERDLPALFAQYQQAEFGSDKNDVVGKTRTLQCSRIDIAE